MEILNLIPLAFLAWVVFRAVRRGMDHGYTENYFNETRKKTGKRFRNFFGIPNGNLK